MTIRNRIDKLEKALGGADDCPWCRGRRGRMRLVIVNEDGQPDRPLPEPCPACGQIPETILRVTEEIVG